MEAGAADRAGVLSQVFQPEAQLADSESRYCIAWPDGPQDVELEPPNFFNRIAEDSGTISRVGGGVCVTFGLNTEPRRCPREAAAAWDLLMVLYCMFQWLD